jgi:hypothetical protein
MMLLFALLALADECKTSLIARPPTLAWEVTFDPKFQAVEQGVRLWRQRGGNAPTVISLPARTRQYVDKNVVQGKTDITYRYRAQIDTDKGSSLLGFPELCYTVTAPVVINLTTAVIEILEVQ